MTSVYALILGADGLLSLASECQALHRRMGRFEGEITVKMTQNPVLRLMLKLVGFPGAFDRAKLVFSKEKQGNKEIWTRHIGDQVMRTVQWVTHGNQLAERLGLMTAISDLIPAEGGLNLVNWRFRCAGVPVPVWAAPRITAFERPDQGRYRFEIAICLPWGKTPIVRYYGWLRPASV